MDNRLKLYTCIETHRIDILMATVLQTTSLLLSVQPGELFVFLKLHGIGICAPFVTCSPKFFFALPISNQQPSIL